VSLAGHDEIRVGFGGRILFVIKVEHRFTIRNAAGIAATWSRKG